MSVADPDTPISQLSIVWQVTDASTGQVAGTLNPNQIFGSDIYSVWTSPAATTTKNYNIVVQVSDGTSSVISAPKSLTVLGGNSTGSLSGGYE